jgi:hypothetical protein
MVPLYEHGISQGAKLYEFIPCFDAPVKNISRYHDQKLFSSYSYLNIKPSGGNYISIHYREPVKT